MDDTRTMDEALRAVDAAVVLAAIEEDRERAPGLLAELLAEAPAVRERMAVTLTRFRSLALAGLLVARSFERRGAGEELAELALAVLGVLDGSWRALVEQRRAEAWGALAEACRLKGDIERAEAAWYRASFHLANAPDPLEEAQFYRLRARLFRDQGKRGPAVALLTRAVDLFARFAAPPLAAEALVELAGLHIGAGEREEALAALIRAGEEVQRND